MQRVVREVTPDDWGSVRDIRLRSLLLDPEAFGARYEVEVTEDEAFWRAFIARQSVVVVERDNVAVAIATIENLDGDFGAACWLGGCWVATEERGHGHLRAIMDYIDEHASARSWSVQGLGVWIDNDVAIRAYESLGFVTVGEPQVSTRQPPRLYQRMIRHVASK
jgi:GNAT superfamily N-acetyltransferase